MSDLPLDVVYLRPESPGVPVDYIKSVEKAGLTTLPQKYLAMYTMGGNPSVGPQGPQGEDRNSWYDVIIAAVTDEVTPITVGGPKFTFRAPYPLDLTTGYIRCHVTTAPQGAAMIIDVHMNGSTMFSTPVHIDAGTETSVGSATPSVILPGALYVPDDAEFEVFVTQIGTTTAGAGLKVSITGIKTS